MIYPVQFYEVLLHHLIIVLANMEHWNVRIVFETTEVEKQEELNQSNNTLKLQPLRVLLMPERNGENEI